jgi:hypothetical protein
MIVIDMIGIEHIFCMFRDDCCSADKTQTTIDVLAEIFAILFVDPITDAILRVMMLCAGCTINLTAVLASSSHVMTGLVAIFMNALGSALERT